MLLVPVARASEVPVTLKGSRASVLRQNEVAKGAGYTFAENVEDLRALVATGVLVPVVGNDDYALREGMSSAVARPEMRLFIERLAAQYHEATGEKLVVTSLTRPQSRQPKNAHALSVHPAGIAVDLRVSQRAKSRQWLERTLLALERQGLLDVTREKWPPHYHVALFPEAYLAHVDRLIGPRAVVSALTGVLPAPDAPEAAEAPEAADAARDTTATPAPAGEVQARHDANTGLWRLLAILPIAALLIGVAGLQRGWTWR